jgi:O-antigen ligase
VLKVDLGSRRALETTTSGRFDLVTGAAELYWQRPALGYGSGAFAEEFAARGLAGADGAGDTSTTKSHTAPLTVAAEQGIVGLAALAVLLWVAFATVFNGAARRYRPGHGARIAVAAAFTVVFVHSLTYAALLEDPLTWVLLGCALGLAAIPRVGEPTSSNDGEAE